MFDRRIKFRHLQCFLAVAHHHSVVVAATRLSLSQPAVSKTLRELEEILGASLIDRSRRDRPLTPIGEVFLRHAAASVTALKQGVDSVDEARTTSGPPIRVGVLPSVAARLMPRAILRFERLLPATSLYLATGENQSLLDELRWGELDLVVGRMGQSGSMAGLSFEHLYSERVALAVRPGHPLLETDPVDLNRMSEFTIIYPPEAAVIRPAVDRFLLANGLSALGPRIETVSNTFGRVYARDTQAIWITSYGAIAMDVARGELVEIKAGANDTTGPVGVTQRTDGVTAPPLALLIKAIHDSASELERDLPYREVG